MPSDLFFAAVRKLHDMLNWMLTSKSTRNGLGWLSHYSKGWQSKEDKKFDRRKKKNDIRSLMKYEEHE